MSKIAQKGWLVLAFKGLILACLLVVSVGALGLWAAAAQADRLRPNLEKSLTQVLGMRVQIGRIGLRWHGGPEVWADGITVGEDVKEALSLKCKSVAIRFTPWEILAWKPVLYSVMEDGRLHFRDETQSPPVEIQLGGIEARAEQVGVGKVKVDIRLRDGTLDFTGEGALLGGPPRVRGKLTVNGINLERIVRERVSGIVRGSADFEGAGQSKETFLKSLKAEGSFEIEDGVLRGVNVVQNLIARVPATPAMQSLLVGTLPPSVSKVLRGQDTFFEYARAQARVESGRIFLEPSSVKGQDYGLQAGGEIDLSGALAMSGRLTIQGALSQFLLARAPGLAVLVRGEGVIEVPFLVRGEWPSRVRFYPDLPSLARDVVKTRGTELLEMGLEALSKRLGEKPQ